MYYFIMSKHLMKFLLSQCLSEAQYVWSKVKAEKKIFRVWNKFAENKNVENIWEKQGKKTAPQHYVVKLNERKNEMKQHKKCSLFWCCMRFSSPAESSQGIHWVLMPNFFSYLSAYSSVILFKTNTIAKYENQQTIKIMQT